MSQYILKCESASRRIDQETALVGAFSVIVKTDSETDGSSAALLQSHCELIAGQQSTLPGTEQQPAAASRTETRYSVSGQIR